MTNEVYIGAPELRRRYQITPPTLRRWLATGQFPQPDLRVTNRSKWLQSTIAAFEAHLMSVSDHAINTVGTSDRPGLNWGRYRLVRRKCDAPPARTEQGA
jgi:hypothetical protein